jgi:hypothetical protein
MKNIDFLSHGIVLSCVFPNAFKQFFLKDVCWVKLSNKTGVLFWAGMSPASTQAWRGLSF